MPENKRLLAVLPTHLALPFPNMLVAYGRTVGGILYRRR